MGLRTPGGGPTATTSPSNKNGTMIVSTLPGVRRTRSRSSHSSSNGSLPVVVNVNSRRISQSTLHKIFVGMMMTAFGFYVVFTAFLIRHHHNHDSTTNMDPFGNNNGNKWGPNNIMNNDEILKAHIQRLRERQQLKQQEREEQYFTSNKRDDQQHRTAQMQIVSADGQATPKQPHQVSLTLEEVDIHDMKHPKHIRKGVQHPQPPLVDKHSSTNTERRILKAFLETTHLPDWDVRPLPVRNTTRDDLTVIEYPRVDSCRRLPELWPIDDYPDSDPFLPWIHDVFPTDDGKFIQFVAQNKRRCQTGTTPDQINILERMQPQIALFQHVPIQRIHSKNQENTTIGAEEVRYKLTSHEKADPDGIETRFICRFSTGEETLSQFIFNYDYVAKRKRSSRTFTKEGHKDNKSIHTSQLIFLCPVPESLIDTVRDGSSVIDDWATLFLTLIPIRTPPRYGSPDRFLPPKYQLSHLQNFSVTSEWGDSHILPRVEDSGRWENIPICLPTWKAFPSVTAPPPKEERSIVDIVQHSTTYTKKNRVVTCTWASTSYATRGDRFAIDDGARRLDEWIRFHLLTGMDHIFVYDNSRSEHTLESVTSQFPDRVTRISWPATICNNNRSFDDSPGERSSQYAAESSCRLRFGPHSDWMASMDIDEYIAPTGEYESIRPFLDELDKNNTKVTAFGSWRAWPRRDLIEPPVKIVNKTICEQPHPCFELIIPTNRSVLQTYNCDRQLVKKETMPAEKQIYRTDYVLQHFIHFSTVTLYTIMTGDEVSRAGMKWVGAAPDPLLKFADERTEVTMLHTKAMATQDTAGWETRCKGEMKGTCRIGVPFPDLNTSSPVTKDEDGWLYNCYVNPKIENYWVPRLNEELKSSSIVDFSVE